jgi:phosphate/sulfate permease
MDEFLVGLAVSLGFLFGWNNGALLLGPLRGSGTASLRTALVTSTLGLVAGALLEGWKLYTGMTGTLAPSTTDLVLLVTLATSVAFTLVLTLMGLPVSFSMVMVAAFLGSSVSASIPVDTTRAAGVVLFWLGAPVITAALAFVAYTCTSRLVGGLGILVVDAFNRFGSIVSALLVSYTLGANNVGLILGGTGATPAASQSLGVVAAIILAAVAGIAVSTRSRVSGTMGDRMLSLSPQGVFTVFAASAAVVWVGTQFAIPLSISQCLLGGIFGAAYTKNIAVLNRQLATETVMVWFIAPVLAFLAGAVLVFALGGPPPGLSHRLNLF